MVYVDSDTSHCNTTQLDLPLASFINLGPKQPLEDTEVKKDLVGSKATSISGASCSVVT